MSIYKTSFNLVKAENGRKSQKYGVKFISFSDVSSPFEADDWIFLPFGLNTKETDFVQADHIIVTNGFNKKSDAIVPGTLPITPIRWGNFLSQCEIITANLDMLRLNIQ